MSSKTNSTGNVEVIGSVRKLSARDEHNITLRNLTLIQILLEFDESIGALDLKITRSDRNLMITRLLIADV